MEFIKDLIKNILLIFILYKYYEMVEVSVDSGIVPSYLVLFVLVGGWIAIVMLFVKIFFQMSVFFKKYFLAHQAMVVFLKLL